MTISDRSKTTSANPTLVIVSSVILPGFGQFLIKKFGRGLLIFLTTAVLAFLINWSLVHQNIAKLTIGSMVTSWLWLPLSLFWVWNVLDVRAQITNQSFNVLSGIIFAALILYVIAWNVTDVKLNRLVERFNDARTVAANLLNPDVITISINGNDQICAWSCIYTYVNAKLIGQPTAGTIRWSDNLLDIVGRVKLLPAPKWQVNF